MSSADRKRAYALCILDRRIGPFRSDRSGAEEDALEMGHASRDDHDGRIYLIVPAEIGTFEFTRVE